MGLSSELKGLSVSDYATAGLYAGLIGLVLADLIPTPADALTLDLQRDIRDKWKNNEISAFDYWVKNLTYYYLPNVLWWVLILIIAVSIPGSAKKKFQVALILIGAGAVIGTVYSLYKKDVKQQALQKLNFNS